MELLSSLITSIICATWGLIGYKVAKKKNLNPKLWAGLLVGFGLFAFIFLLFKKSKAKQAFEQPIEKSTIALAKIIQDNWYFLNKEHQTHGPIKFDELRDEFEKGNVTKKSLVWNATYSDWKKLEDDIITIEELEKRS